MAQTYRVKYELLFDDVVGRKYLLEILQRNYDGDVLPIIGGASPVKVEWVNDDDIYYPIIGSRCKLNFFVTDAIQYDEFFRADEREYKVRLGYYTPTDTDWNGANAEWDKADFIWNSIPGGATFFETFWEGYLLTDRYSEAIVSAPFPLQLEAVDGLGTLSGFEAPINKPSSYVAGSDTRKTAFYYIKEILKLTGNDFPIWIAHDTRSTTGVADETIFHDFKLENFGILEQNFETMNAKKVLENILRITNSRIFQSHGRWYIVNNSSLIDKRVDQLTLAPSGSDIQIEPAQAVTAAEQTLVPNIRIIGQTSLQVKSTFRFQLANDAGPNGKWTSITWTLTDGTTYTTDTVSFPATIDLNGDTLSVTVSNAAGSDTASVVLSVADVVEVPGTDENNDPYSAGVLTINVNAYFSNTSVEPAQTNISFDADQVGDPYSTNVDLVPTNGFTWPTGSTVTFLNLHPDLTATQTLTSEGVIRLTFSGNYPNGGQTYNVNLESDYKPVTKDAKIAVGFTETVTNANLYNTADDVQITGGTRNYYGKPGEKLDFSFYLEGVDPYVINKKSANTITERWNPVPTFVKKSTYFDEDQQRLYVTGTFEFGTSDIVTNLVLDGNAVTGDDATTITIDPQSTDENSPIEMSGTGGYIIVSVDSIDGDVRIDVDAGINNDWFSLTKYKLNENDTAFRINLEANTTGSDRDVILRFYAGDTDTLLLRTYWVQKQRQTGTSGRTFVAGG
jgi:hypothetical protein